MIPSTNRYNLVFEVEGIGLEFFRERVAPIVTAYFKIAPEEVLLVKAHGSSSFEVLLQTYYDTIDVHQRRMACFKQFLLEEHYGLSLHIKEKTIHYGSEPNSVPFVKVLVC